MVDTLEKERRKIYGNHKNVIRTIDWGTNWILY